MLYKYKQFVYNNIPVSDLQFSEETYLAFLVIDKLQTDPKAVPCGFPFHLSWYKIFFIILGQFSSNFVFDFDFHAILFILSRKYRYCQANNCCH
jgi:hypothetical protein